MSSEVKLAKYRNENAVQKCTQQSKRSNFSNIFFMKCLLVKKIIRGLSQNKVTQFLKNIIKKHSQIYRTVYFEEYI